jgi:hypothetical protein
MTRTKVSGKMADYKFLLCDSLNEKSQGSKRDYILKEEREEEHCE